MHQATHFMFLNMQGSVAAPTAGLHLTEEVLTRMRTEKQVQVITNSIFMNSNFAIEHFVNQYVYMCLCMCGFEILLNKGIHHAFKCVR